MDDKQREILQKKYDEIIAKNFANVNKTHTKKEFTFTIPEKRRIIQQETITFLANQAINDIIDFSVLPRLGLLRTPQVLVFYDASLGRFTVCIPKESNPEQQPSKPDQKPS